MATEKNERIPEHFRRLRYANKYFRRLVVFDSTKHMNIYKNFDDQGFLIRTMGDEFLNPSASTALPEKRELDDMGLVYMRHGEPAIKVFFIGGDTVPQNASWMYNPTYNHPEMIFHFVKHGGTRGWFLESVPSYFNERGEFGGDYAILDPELNPRGIRYSQAEIQDMHLRIQIGLLL